MELTKYVKVSHIPQAIFLFPLCIHLKGDFSFLKGKNKNYTLKSKDASSLETSL